MITVKCQCGTSFRTKASNASKHLRCRSCGAALEIPEAGSTQPPTAEIPRPKQQWECPNCHQKVDAGRNHCPSCLYHVGSVDEFGGKKRWVVKPTNTRARAAPWAIERSAHHLKCTSFWIREDYRERAAVVTFAMVLFIVFVCPWMRGTEHDPNAPSMIDRSGSFAATLPFTLTLSAATVYLMLAMMFNRTELHISDGRLAVRYPPFPLLRGMSLPTEEITQVFCRRIAHGAGRGREVSYALFAVLNNEVRRKLFHGLPFDEPDVARQLESEIESFLGLADIRVDEIPPEDHRSRFSVQRLCCGLLIVGLLGMVLPIPFIGRDVQALAGFIAFGLAFLGGFGWLMARSSKDQFFGERRNRARRRRQ